MYFFEEMMVYVFVFVFVNGNMYYISESIECLLIGNGNISDLLRINFVVCMDLM